MVQILPNLLYLFNIYNLSIKLVWNGKKLIVAEINHQLNVSLTLEYCIVTEKIILSQQLKHKGTISIQTRYM